MKLLHNQRFEEDRCKNILHLPFLLYKRFHLKNLKQVIQESQSFRLERSVLFLRGK